MLLLLALGVLAEAVVAAEAVRPVDLYFGKSFVKLCNPVP